MLKKSLLRVLFLMQLVNCCASFTNFQKRELVAHEFRESKTAIDTICHSCFHPEKIIRMTRETRTMNNRLIIRIENDERRRNIEDNLKKFNGEKYILHVCWDSKESLLSELFESRQSTAGYFAAISNWLLANEIGIKKTFIFFVCFFFRPGNQPMNLLQDNVRTTPVLLLPCKRSGNCGGNVFHVYLPQLKISNYPLFCFMPHSLSAPLLQQTFVLL